MFHHVSTSHAPYWPSTTKYQPVPPSTDPVLSYTNQYDSILTQYHQVSTFTNLYSCCTGITDFCTVYPGSCFLLILFYNTHRLNVTSLSFHFHQNFCCLLHLDFNGETATEKSGELDERGEEERQNPGNTKICNFMAYEFSGNIALSGTVYINL